MNIWSELILPIVPFLGMLLFLILLLVLLKSGYTEVVTFLLFTMLVVTVCLVMVTHSNEVNTLTHYPVRITNPESVDEKLSSALYTYLWTFHISSPATILDWDENTKQMTYRLGNSTYNQVVKMGVESFYK